MASITKGQETRAVRAALIIKAAQSGVSVEMLADIFGLAERTIRHIIAEGQATTP